MQTLKIFIILCLLFIKTLITCAQQSPVEKSYRDCEDYSLKCVQTPVCTENVYVIRVLTQNDLKSISSNIRKAIKKGEKNIEVNIAQGVFYYDRLPVDLYNIDAEDVSISIFGNNSVLVAGGEDYQNGKTLSLLNNNVYLDDGLDLIDPYEEVTQSKGEVEVLDETTKECRIAINKEYKYKTGMKIQISEWFHSPVYEVTKVNDGFVYFKQRLKRVIIF